MMPKSFSASLILCSIFEFLTEFMAEMRCWTSYLYSTSTFNKGTRLLEGGRHGQVGLGRLAFKNIIFKLENQFSLKLEGVIA